MNKKFKEKIDKILNIDAEVSVGLDYFGTLDQRLSKKFWQDLDHSSQLTEQQALQEIQRLHEISIS